MSSGQDIIKSLQFHHHTLTFKKKTSRYSWRTSLAQDTNRFFCNYLSFSLNQTIYPDSISLMKGKFKHDTHIIWGWRCKMKFAKFVTDNHDHDVPSVVTIQASSLVVICPRSWWDWWVSEFNYSWCNFRDIFWEGNCIWQWHVKCMA